jgi:hypothetical protein
VSRNTLRNYSCGPIDFRDYPPFTFSPTPDKFSNIVLGAGFSTIKKFKKYSRHVAIASILFEKNLPKPPFPLNSKKAQIEPRGDPPTSCFVENYAAVVVKYWRSEKKQISKKNSAK